MSVIHTEHVLVVPTSEFHQIGYFQGISTDVQRYLDRLLQSDIVRYRPRQQMEQDPSYKQLIPYVIFRHQDDQQRPWLFQYTRGTGQGEQRLHRKRSVGVGGHISSEDAGVTEDADPYAEGLRRELEEEVWVRTPYVDRRVALINDDETDVGRVHLGVVHIFDVERPEVEPREEELQDAGFRPVDELLSDLDGMESWSRICLQGLFL